MNDIFLETPRLILRVLSDAIFPDFHAQQKDPDFMKFFGGPRDDDKIKTVFNLLCQHQQEHGYSQGMIFEKATGTCIGRAGLTHLEFTLPEVEFSVFLLPTYWNEGYATELAEAMIHYAFNVLNLPSIYATVDRDNTIACYGCEKKLGMTLEREGIYTNAVIQKPVRYYRLDRPKA